MDWVARLLLWLEPYLAWGLGLIEGGSPAAALLAVPTGVALGLTPMSYPMVPAVVGYAAGGENTTVSRRAVLSLSFSAGVITVYALLGVAFATLGLALMTLLNRSIWLWFALLAPFLWIMGQRLVGVLWFDMPFSAVRTPSGSKEGGVYGAYLLGLPFGLAGCPSCALILPSLLTAVAASGSPYIGVLVLVGLGVGQGMVLVAAGTMIGGIVRFDRIAPYRIFVEKAIGVVLLLTAAYFTWRALIWF